jgi:hypothetical protein
MSSYLIVAAEYSIGQRSMSISIEFCQPAIACGMKRRKRLASENAAWL